MAKDFNGLFGGPVAVNSKAANPLEQFDPITRGVVSYSGGMTSVPFALYDLGQTAGGWTMSGDWKPSHEGEQWYQNFTGIQPTNDMEQALYDLGQAQGGAKMVRLSNQGAYKFLGELGSAIGAPSAGLPSDIAEGQQYIDPQTGRYYTNLGSLTNTPYGTNFNDLPQTFQGWEQPPDRISNYPNPPEASPYQVPGDNSPQGGDVANISTAPATWSGGYPWYDATLPSGWSADPNTYQFSGYTGPSGYTDAGTWGYNQPGYGLAANSPQTEYADVPGSPTNSFDPYSFLADYHGANWGQGPGAWSETGDWGTGGNYGGGGDWGSGGWSEGGPGSSDAWGGTA